MPSDTPAISAIQSCRSALRPKEGCITFISPPYVLAATKTGMSPMWPVEASGKASAEMAIRCTTLSVPSGAGVGLLIGQTWPLLNSRHDQCERDIEILTHVNRLKALGSEHKENLRLAGFAVKAKIVSN